ncbi:S1 family peptidase [Flavobacterium sp.]|uniref:S1 family peptidase n=1 Tax=Flavobacterium sp. TaxID=239 RepID=UPI003C47F081
MEDSSSTPIEKETGRSPRRKKIIIGLISLLIIMGIIGYFKYLHNNSSSATDACFETDTEIYEYYKNAVVLVKHEYSYTVNINGTEFVLEVSDIPIEKVYGTGFLVDGTGLIATNRHVLEPWNTEGEEEATNRNLNNIRMKIASILTTDIEREDYKSFIETNWSQGRIYFRGEGDGEGEGYSEGESETVSSEGGEEFVSSNNFDEEKAQTDIASTIEEKVYVSEGDIEVTVTTINLSVAFHGSEDSWHDCEIVKLSDDSAIDLGLIQSDVTSDVYISLDTFFISDNELRPGEKVFMLGFPLGEDFAKSNTGLKVQFYKGEISRETDGEKIQYSIPSTGGASGSPVFNQCGQLIAINYSGIDQVDNYTFGIVANHLVKLIE